MSGEDSIPTPSANTPDASNVSSSEELAQQFGSQFDLSESKPYTTEDVPNDIKLRAREKIDANHPLFDEWKGQWSQWVLAMTPNGIYPNVKSRSTGFKKTDQELKAKLKNALPADKLKYGIYEWKAKHATKEKEYVVIIGSTGKDAKLKGILPEVICKYCKSGGDENLYAINDLINNALISQYELWVRCKSSVPDGCGPNEINIPRKKADEDINQVLKHYDYAWSKSIRNLPCLS